MTALLTLHYWIFLAAGTVEEHENLIRSLWWAYYLITHPKDMNGHKSNSEVDNELKDAKALCRAESQVITVV